MEGDVKPVWTHYPHPGLMWTNVYKFVSKKDRGGIRQTRASTPITPLPGIKTPTSGMR